MDQKIRSASCIISAVTDYLTYLRALLYVCGSAVDRAGVARAIPFRPAALPRWEAGLPIERVREGEEEAL